MDLKAALAEKQKINGRRAALMKKGCIQEALDTLSDPRNLELVRFLQEHDPFEWDYHGKYLRSPLWRRIKRRVLKRDNHECRRHECGRKAAEVHHRSYAPEVMRGEDDSKLISLCSSCHSFLSVNEKNEKRSLEEQERLLLAKPDRSAMPPIEIVRGRFAGEAIKAALHPGNGFSVAQLAAWRERLRVSGIKYVRLGPRRYWPV